MIEKMKKVTVIALENDHETTLKTLRDLEIIHITYNREESSEFARSMREVERLDYAIRALKEFDVDTGSEAGKFGKMHWNELAEEVIAMIGKLEEAREDVLELHREVDEWIPWGNFDPSTVLGLREKGVFLELCRCPANKCPDLPDGAYRIDVARSDEDQCFVVASNEPFDSDELPVVSLPSKCVQELGKDIQALEKTIDELKNRLTKAATQKDMLTKALLKRSDAADLVHAGNAMSKEGVLEYIQGYIPDNRKGELTQMAYRRGWGLMIEEPDPQKDVVPTLLRVPKWLNVTKPLFEFVGISPGYKEFDVSAWFLIFFTIFFGMILGDGGYGALFLGVALFAKSKMKTTSAKRVSNLFIILSLTTIGWGFLTGNFFGLPNGWTEGSGWIAENATVPRFMCGIEWFAGADKGNMHTQLFCFAIAVVHLSIAHGWQALVSLNKPLRALGQLGWLCFVWGAFFMILKMVLNVEMNNMSMVYGLLGGGFLLMLLFSVDWKDIGDILNFPFGALGGFVDILSYIRLFAVGLSGLYVAKSINDMGTALFDLGIVGVIGGVIVLLGGHFINIALCSMGVLVHGIRLNTLEFSGHLGLEWSGIAFKPFRKRSKQIN